MILDFEDKQLVYILIYCFLFLLLRLYLAHLKEVHQNHFQLIPENVRKRNMNKFAPYQEGFELLASAMLVVIILEAL